MIHSIDDYIKLYIISTVLFILSFILVRTSYMRNTRERIKIKRWYIVVSIIVTFLPILNVSIGIFIFILLILAGFARCYDNSFINKLRNSLDKEI